MSDRPALLPTLSPCHRSRKPAQFPKLPPIPKLPLESADMVLGTTARVAAGSPNLSVKERTELGRLAEKAKKTGRAGAGTTDRVRLLLLITKTGPESLPNELPPWLRRLLGTGDRSGTKLRRARPDVDPLLRIEKLHPLRRKPLTETQYQHEVDRVISRLSLGAFSGIDQLDRLEMVQKLRESGALTEDQVAVVMCQILDPR